MTATENTVCNFRGSSVSEVASQNRVSTRNRHHKKKVGAAFFKNGAPDMAREDERRDDTLRTAAASIME
jgi:hypothetical protein